MKTSCELFIAWTNASSDISFVIEPINKFPLETCCRLSPKRGGVLAAPVLVGILTFIFLGKSIHLAPARAATQVRALPASSISNILATFYPNPADSGTFNVDPTISPAFTQTFPTLDFNPPANFQFCSTSSGIDEHTRPFTNLSQNADGSCTTIVAQGNGEQAGINDLYSFQAEFLATLVVPQAGQFDMNIYADDGWILSLGADSNGNQPVYVAGPMNDAPVDDKGPFSRTISRPVQSVLLAPMPAGITLKIIHGYNDPLPGQSCPKPGNGIADHCMNQQYGLDLQPVATGSDPNPSHDIIASAAGIVAWVQNDCLGLRLDSGDVNLTICHFASFQPNIYGTRVVRGAYLGTMSDHIHLSIDDRYQDVTHSDCSPSNASTCRPIPFNGGYYRQQCWKVLLRRKNYRRQYF